WDGVDAAVQGGRIGGPYGGSSWTRERMDAAIAYAKRTGKTAPAVLSNNFSLAEMVNPVWDGCVAASDDARKAWFMERQVTNFAWSSQGRGFFTENADRDTRDSAELVRPGCPGVEFARRDRRARAA